MAVFRHYYLSYKPVFQFSAAYQPCVDCLKASAGRLWAGRKATAVQNTSNGYADGNHDGYMPLSLAIGGVDNNFGYYVGCLCFRVYLLNESIVRPQKVSSDKWITNKNIGI